MRQRLHLGILAFVFPLLSGCHHGDAKAPSTDHTRSAVVAPVVQEDIASTLTVSGEFQPYQEVDLHAKVSGYIRRINVDIGDRVRIGQVIATLEVPELTAQVAGAQAEVRHSQFEITRAQSEIAKAQSSHTAVHAAFTRLQEASKDRPGLIAAQELDDAAAKDQDAEAEINVAKAGLEATRQQLGVSVADTQRVQSLSAYSVVTAPFAGVITKRFADTGSLIQAGTTSNTQAMPVVRIAQSDLLRLRMPVPEADVQFIKEGGKAQVRVQATGRTFIAKIIRFSRALDESTRTMLVEVDVLNPDLSLSPGMFAETTLTLQQHNNVLTVPTQAVVQGDKPYVLVVDQSGTVAKREVVLGIQGTDRMEIQSGLEVGEHIVVSGQINYQTGEKVSPVEEGRR